MRLLSPTEVNDRQVSDIDRPAQRSAAGPTHTQT